MQKSNKTAKTLLQAKHFKGRSTKWRAGGLRFDKVIGMQERDERVITGLEIGDDERETRIAVNPVEIPASEVFDRLSEGEDRSTAEETPRQAKKSANSSYDLAWSVKHNDNDYIGEGQQLLVIVFQKNRPAGFARVYLGVNRWKEDGGVCCHINLDYFYVTKTLRGLGLSVDLTAAVAEIAEDLIIALHRAVTGNVEIRVEIYAEWVSEGGATIANAINEHVETICASLVEKDHPEYKKGVSYEVDYEAGW